MLETVLLCVFLCVRWGCVSRGRIFMIWVCWVSSQCDRCACWDVTSHPLGPCGSFFGSAIHLSFSLFPFSVLDSLLYKTHDLLFPAVLIFCPFLLLLGPHLLSLSFSHLNSCSVWWRLDESCCDWSLFLRFLVQFFSNNTQTCNGLS